MMGKNIKNIKARVIKGIGIMNRILTLLKGAPFGKLYFEVTLILRNSLLESSVLQNIFYDMIFRMYPTHMRGPRAGGTQRAAEHGERDGFT